MRRDWIGKIKKGFGKLEDKFKGFRKRTILVKLTYKLYREP
jgi:hypothetical protein